MIELNTLRNQTERVLTGLRKRNLPQAQLDLVDQVLNSDQLRKSLQASLDNQLARLNQLSRDIGQLMKEGKGDHAQSAREEVAAIKQSTREEEIRLVEIQEKIEGLLVQLPNVPHESVPVGTSADDNEVYEEWLDPMPTLGSGAKPHWELAKDYRVFDMELGVKISGSGFMLYRQNGARLQRALINFFLDQASQAGYEEIWAPLLVNKDSARGTGQLPDKEGQMYYVEKDDLYLIPTAEVPVTNMYRDVILKEEELPIRLTGYTPCFRREAGSYGAHVKGLNRVHQFDKVEIVRMEHPDRSYEALMQMLDHVRGLEETGTSIPDSAFMWR